MPHPKHVLSPIARFSNLWNANLVFDLCNILFVFLRQNYLKCGTFGQQTPKVGQMPHQNKFLAQLLVLATYGTQVWFSIFVI